MVKSWQVWLAILWLQLSWVRCKNGVEQSPQYLSVQEGELVTINCSFPVGMTTLHWMQQNPGRSLITLFVLSLEMKKKGRIQITIDTEKKHSSLLISASQPRDSAVYLCAVEIYGNNRLTFGAGTRLTVTPNIRDPKPTVYQLTKSRSSNMTVCLYTDYQSGEDISKVTEDAVFSTNTTVLQMKSTGSKSNAILVWDHRVDFTCRSVFKDNILVDTSEVPCDATLVEKNFRTDWNLNFQNLLVIVFRILFLKLSGFNLLMTLRLWSC